MRYVDAFREGDKTRMTAVWSDEDYQLGKIVDRGEDLNIDPEVPMCPGCKRLAHIEGKSEDGYSNHMINAGNQSTEQVLSYYEQSLESRGWKSSEVGLVVATSHQLRLRTDDPGMHATGEPARERKALERVRGGLESTQAALEIHQQQQVRCLLIVLR